MGNHDSYNEQNSLKALSGGDIAAFEQIYTRYRDKVYYTSLHVLQDATAAQDAVQEIFIKVWVNREKFEEMEYFPAWLHTVIRNHLYYRIRQKAQQEIHLLHLVNTGPGLADENTYNETEFRELLQLVNKAMDELTGQQRLVFDMSRMQGLKHREIAEKLGISQETVKKHIMEALRHVRAYLQSHGKVIPVVLLLQLLHF